MLAPAPTQGAQHKEDELALLYLILGFIGPGIHRAGPALPFEPLPYTSSHLVRFANGAVVNTRTEPRPGPESTLRAGSYWLVNLDRPVGSATLAGLRRVGLEPVGYLAYQNVVCRATREIPARSVLELPHTTWLGPPLPEYKTAPELDSTYGPVELVLALRPDRDGRAVADAVTAAGGEVLAVSSRTVLCRTESAHIPELAKLDEVSWLQMPDPVRPLNSDAQWVMQVGWRPEVPEPTVGRRVWSRGIRGQSMTVGLTDAGIFTAHDQFRDPLFPVTAPGIFPEHRKLAGYKLYRHAAMGDFSNFHGTGVAGTLAGNDSVCGNRSKADGLAPDARIFFVDVGTSYNVYTVTDDLSDLFDTLRLAPGLGEPVRQASGSFGSDARLGYYRLMDATLDAVAWQDKGFLVVWAAGNAGGDQYRIGHPSCAKSALTVGASGNGTSSNLVAVFSSRGPTRDGRIKPNVVAPGAGVTTAAGPSASYYSLRDGTSLAAPAVSGSLLLARQYLEEGWFPLGRPDSANSIPCPSSALLRGLAVAGTDTDCGPDPVPANSIGWGRLNLANLLRFEEDTLRLTFTDDTVGLATGEFHEYTFNVTARERLRVALAWTDTAGAPEALIAIVNDLDLELISPDQNGYRGNQFLDGESRANPAERDAVNVEEVCLLNHPLAGTWTARVKARNVFTARQPYALVVRGTIAGIPGVAQSAPCLGAGNSPATVFVSRAAPLRLKVPARARLAFYCPLGRRIDTRQAGLDGLVVWDGAGRASSGVYFYSVELPYGTVLRGRLLLVR